MTDISFPSIYVHDPNPEGRPVVLLIHGLGSDHSSWVFQIDALIEKKFRPIAIDLPGFGKSSKIGIHWTLESCVDICIRILDDFGIQTAHICGLSLGGVIAQLITIRYPEKVDSLILINTFACLRPQKTDEWIYLLKRLFISMFLGKDKQAELVAERLFPAPELDKYRQEVVNQIRNADPTVYQQALRALGLLDIRKKDRKIKTKTLVITAEMDTTVPVKNQVEMAKCIQNARQVFIPKSRHAVIIDQPDLTNQVMLEFLVGESLNLESATDI